MRLIDVDALFEQMKKLYQKRSEESNMTGDRAVCVTWNDAVFCIKDSPAVDAVPVVRCRDCKYSDTFSDECEPTEFPLKCLSIRYGGVYPDWFCEHGQRREDGADNG